MIFKRPGSFRSATVLSLLCGILLAGIPSRVSGQKTDNFQPNTSLLRDMSDADEQPATDTAVEENSSLLSRNRRSPRQPPIYTPPSQWDIAGQTGVKITTNRNDWYHVSAAALQAAGFDPNTDSSYWQMFVDGQQIPIRVNADRSVEFYGRGADTLHTDAKVFYLIQGTVFGQRLPEANTGSAGQTPDATYFQTETVFDERKYYFTSILNGETENWYAEIVSPNSISINITADKLASAGQASLELNFQGLTEVQHLIGVRINDHDIGMATFLNKHYHQSAFNVPVAYLNEGNNQIKIQAVGGGSDFSLLDSVTLRYPKRFEAAGNKLNFKVPAGQAVRVGGFTNNNIKLIELHHGEAVQKLAVASETVNGTFGFSLSASSGEREFIAVADSVTVLPFRIAANIPSAWNASSNQADFVIITPAELSPYAQNLANRRESQGIRTKVVLTEDIADEFSYGAVTPEAIRDFLKHATTVWSRTPGYVLLFGDSSFDMRNYQSVENRNLVPTKLIETFDMETSSDGWLTDFDDDGVENIPIGRLPVGNAAEANQGVEKIVRYETQNVTTNKSAVLVADYFFETLNGALQNLLPTNVNSTRIERMTMNDTQMRQEILDNANQNPTFVSYLGHGTTGVWSTGNVFGIQQAQGLNNQKLSFYMLMTCLNGFTHNAETRSLAEALVLSENGAIAVWASSGSTYASGQIFMGQEVVKRLFPSGKKKSRVGDVVKTSKQFSNDWDARRTWQLMGDPTLIIE
jgi:hypothetical protein